MPLDLRLYVITDATRWSRTHEEVAAAALQGGATVLQFREKRATTRALYETARRLQELCRACGVPFIVNDRLDIALAVDADGVHLGSEDLPVAVARRILGPHRIVGASAGSVEEALRAEEEGASYLGVGSVYVTGTKPDAGAPIGPDGLVKIVRAVRIPVVGIGGITLDRVPEVIQAGAAGVAVISAVAAAADMVEATRALRRAVDEALARRPEVRM
ncbi:MAG: thiamine phosphate synthase [Armatimonadota bacterium]|nr:thiamine phosphate synthase [Armatimonadota bacterium]MDR7438342.1 thiamine phosphate synthase [Armatimonadota bacterium]MDR7443336.1 thiamine phosphate synthase [Armatimonadota bacterium]MDR7563392.1 thiamine phosphate synthase [Armatimonadota bacterium]MDR7567133.1 thiamine phosphate synthase [Armatimonadota bacterium]